MTEHKTLAEALVAAQAELKNVGMSRVNPHFKSKYADLASIREAVTPILTAHGLAVVQTTHLEVLNNTVVFVLKTTLLHVSDQKIEAVYPLPMTPDAPQKLGSSITYARRYAISAILGIASEDDDDGEAAQSVARKSALSDAMVTEIRNCRAAASLETWWANSGTKAQVLRLDEAEQDRVRKAYTDRLQELKKA